MEFFRRWEAWRRRHELSAELERELRDHIDSRASELRADGLTKEATFAQARREFGNPMRVIEESRESWRWALADDLAWDVRYAVRLVRLNPWFTVAAVGMLALGIGVNAMVFSIANTVLFKGYSGVRDNHRLVYMTTFEGCCVSYPDFLDWRSQARSLQGMEITHGIQARITQGTGSPERYDATEVSSGTFRLVGAQPILGRDFAPADEVVGAEPVAILQYDFWQRRFLGDPAVIGRKLRINGAVTTVIGVMPRGFLFPQRNELWTPLVQSPNVMKRDNRQTWMVVGRLVDGIRIETARAEIQAIANRLEAAYPETNKDTQPFIETYTEFLYGRNSTLLYGTLWGSVGFVLLIACANLANLLLARGVNRSREMSLRLALGASRWRIIRQLLIESLLTAAAGGFVGWWIARWSLQAFVTAVAQSSWMAWIAADYSLDAQALFYVVAISIGTGVLFGLVPALRLSSADAGAKLKEGGRSHTVGVHGKRLSALLVITEMALAVVLLAGAGVMMRSFLKLYNADLGIDAKNLLSFNLEWPEGRQLTPADEGRFYDRLLPRLRAIPGVASVALTSRLPSETVLRQPYALDGEAPGQGVQNRTLSRVLVGPDYIKTLGARILEGRGFTDADREGAATVALVNERFAAEHWPGRSPIGRRLRLLGRTPGSAPSGPELPQAWLTVVGVVSNVAQDITQSGFTPLVYVPYAQRPAPGMSVLARTATAPASLLPSFRRAVQEVDPGLTIWRLETLEGTLRHVYWKSQFYSTLFLSFAAIALLLASAGLYAVTAHAVSQRSQEIGVRMALGGSPAQILSLVFRQEMAPVVIGLIIGLGLSFVTNQVLRGQLVQVSPNDPLTLAAVVAVLALAAIVGCLGPARKAIQVDPAVALRQD